MATNEEWRSARLPYLRGLSRPNKSQRLLLDLLAVAKRSPNEETQLEALWKLEQLNARAEAARIAAYKAVRGESHDRRKARTRKLIQLGALVEKAGMGEDKGVLLGALRAAAERLTKPDAGAVTQRLKARGDAELAELERLRKIPGINPIIETDDAAAKGRRE